MGRFDALTHIEEKQPTSIPPAPSPVSTGPQPKTKTPNESDKKSTDASLLANQQTNKTSKNADLLVNQQDSKEANKQTTLPTNIQTSNLQPALSTKEKKKYGTYLTDESISAIQVHAIQTKRKDHEVLQQAVDEYFKRINR